MFTKFTSEQLFARSNLLDGYDQQVVQQSTVAVVGTGGLGGWAAVQLVRKGFGRIVLIDHDRVSVSNLSRQPFCARDVGGFKSECLARNLEDHTISGTDIIPIPLGFCEAVEFLDRLPRFDAILCGVDNDATRREVCEYGISNQIPVLFYALDLAAESFAVWIQKASGPCLYCLNPSIREDTVIPCAVPSCIDTCFMASGLVVYALDSIIMPSRRLNWNYRKIHVGGFAPDITRRIEKNDFCPFCGGESISECHANTKCASG